MSDHHACQSQFTVEGRFLGFVREDGKLKYLRLAIDQEEYSIKLSKAARLAWDCHLQPDDWIQVWGQQKCDRKTGGCKFKAEQICRKSECLLPAFLPQFLEFDPTVSVAQTSQAKLKIQVCYKSGCQKRGSKKQQQCLEKMLRDRNLQDRVVLQETGCLGKCSMAPNLMLMPGKKRLSGMRPEAIVDLLEQMMN